MHQAKCLWETRIDPKNQVIASSQMSLGNPDRPRNTTLQLSALDRLRLHRLRSNTLRRSRRLQAYRAEFTYCHPHAAPEIAALGFAGLLGATGDFWPMRRLVLECSRLVVVDNAWRATTLQQEVAHDRFRVVAPGVSRRIPAAGNCATLRAEAGRQVTIVSRERWKAVAEALGQHVDPVLRRANLLISGVDLENSRGNILRVGSGRLRVNGETRPADGRTAARLARGAASPMGRRGLRLGPRGREDCGRGPRRVGARCTPEARAVIESSESASAETPRGKPRPSSAQIAPTDSSRAPSHPGPRFGTLAGQSPRTCVTRLPSWAPPRAPRRTPRGPRVRSPSDLLADAERPPAVRTP